MRLDIFHKPAWIVLAAVLAASSVWLFAERMVRYQIADEIVHGRPRGNLSDLYPRWLGARELMRQGRDPYSSAVTRDIQRGFYGRTLDPANPADPKDQEGFAYPLYVVFVLAPTIGFSFAIVQRVAFWVLLALTIATVPLWLRALGWRPPLWASASMVILTVGSLPVMQGLKLQQMTLLVIALVAAAMALLVSDRPMIAGVLLALATIKPQLVWLLLLWLLIWTVGEWRRRYQWLRAFLVTMALLLAASEWYMPVWIPHFFRALKEYRNYTDASSMLDKMVPAPWGWLLGLVTIAATLVVCWKNRRFGQQTQEFATTTALVLAVTVIVTIASNYALYNQILLLPAVLILARERHGIWNRNRVARLMLSLTSIFLLWPWTTNVVLALLSFVLPLNVVDRAWSVPFWTVLPLPMAVAGIVLVMSYQSAFTAPAKPGTS